MSGITLTVNGKAVAEHVEPRTHLADFLREQLLLTGTHLGCEHGVCGACTLLIDGAPARSCIAYAVTCDGSDIRTIEGLEDDPIVTRLRAAFTAEHALQCGYCTPGMLVTARDIVQRLPQADEARIRLELAGNLCRCTGYAGIVRAIRRVLAENVAPAAENPPRALPELVIPAVEASAVSAAPAVAPPGQKMVQVLRIAAPLDRVWAAINDPALVAGCAPGAQLHAVDGNRIRGEVRAALGPIATVFAGEGTIAYDAAAYRSEIIGEARDARTGTRLTGRATVALRAREAGVTEAELAIGYALRGSLAQFARGPVVRELAAEIGRAVAENLEARLSGIAPTPARSLSAGALLWRAVWRRVRALIARSAK